MDEMDTLNDNGSGERHRPTAGSKIYGPCRNAQSNNKTVLAEPFALWVRFRALAIPLADFPCGMAGAEELMFRCPQGFPLLLTRVCPAKEGGVSSPPIRWLRAAGLRSELPEAIHETRRLQPSPAKNLGDSPVSLLRDSLGAVPGFLLLTVCLEHFKNRDCPKVFEKASSDFRGLRVSRSAHDSAPGGFSLLADEGLSGKGGRGFQPAH